MATVFDSDADPDFIHLRYFAENRRPNSCSVSSPPLADVLNRTMRTSGLVFIFVEVGQYQARVQFSVIAIVAVDFVLGTTYTARQVRVAVPPQRKVLFAHNPALGLPGANQPATSVIFDASHTRAGVVNDLLESRKSGWSTQSLSKQ